MRSLLHLALLAPIAVVSTVAEARETGDIRGTVVDQDELPVPGATVTLSGADVAGEVTATTDDRGAFAFYGLLPGTFRVTVRKADGTVLANLEVTVRSDTTTAVPVTVDLATTAEEIEVVYVQPVVDTKASSFSTTMSEDYLQNLPVGRSYTDVVNTLPGVSGRIDTQDGGPGSGNASVRGAGQYGNSYSLDGVVNRDPAIGTANQPVNFDLIEEIQVYTDGAPAEYGQFTGMMVNVQLKDGGDEHHGSVAGFYSQHAWFRKQYDILDVDLGEEVGMDKQRFRTPNLTLAASGPIVKEKLWYAVGGQFGYSWFQGEGIEKDAAQKTWTGNVLGKLTWHAGHGWTLRALYTHDLSFQGNTSTSQLVSPEAQSDRRDQALTGQLTATWKPQWHTELVLRAGYQQTNIDEIPRSGDHLTPSVQTEAGELLYNARNYDLNRRRRVGGGFTVSRVFDRAAGTHKLKAGAEYWFLQQTRDLQYTGATSIEWIDQSGVGTGVQTDVGTEYQADPTNGYPCTQPDGSDCGYRTHWTNVGPIGTKVHTINAFVQDDWSPTPWLTLNVGARVDLQRGINNEGQPPITEVPSQFGQPDDQRTIGKLNALVMPAPRVGLVFDVTRDNKTKISGHYGWYYDLQDSDFWEWANTRSNSGYVRYGRDGAGDWTWAQTQDNSASPVLYEKGLLPPRSDKVNVSIQREIVPLLAIQLRGVLSRTQDIIEDVDVDLNHWYAVNPPIKDRLYRGLEVVLEKKWDGVWQLLASYTLSEALGHTPGQFEHASGADTGGNGNNIGTYLDDVGERDVRAGMYDAGQGWILEGFKGLGRYSVTDTKYDDSAGWYGYLPYHSFHAVKLNFNYKMPWGTNVGVVYELDSGHAWQKKSFVPFYGYDGFAQGRGSRFMPVVNYLDLRLAHMFDLKGSQSVELTLDVFNLLGLQTPISYFENDTKGVGLTLYRQAPRSGRLGLKYRW